MEENIQIMLEEKLKTLNNELNETIMIWVSERERYNNLPQNSQILKQQIDTSLTEIIRKIDALTGDIMRTKKQLQLLSANLELPNNTTTIYNDKEAEITRTNFESPLQPNDTDDEPTIGGR